MIAGPGFSFSVILHMDLGFHDNGLGLDFSDVGHGPGFW